MFPRTSRYYNIEIVKYVTADQREIVYLRRRFLPRTNNSVIIAEHSVVEGDRLDNVTAQYLGDPEQFWRICDANNRMHPLDLASEPGSPIRIARPWS